MKRRVRLEGKRLDPIWKSFGSPSGCSPRLWWRSHGKAMAKTFAKQHKITVCEVGSASVAVTEIADAYAEYLADPNREVFSVVYFVAIDTLRVVKIGFTANPSERLRAYFTCCPFEPRVIGTIRGTVEDEQSLHKRFAHLRSYGEWFHIRDDLDVYLSETFGPDRQPRVAS